MAVEHERDPQPFRRRIEDQLPGIHVTRPRRLQPGAPDRAPPVIERLGHIAVKQDRRPRHVGWHADRARPLGQAFRADHDHSTLVQLARIEALLDRVGDDDRGIDLVAEPLQPVRPGVDIDLQRRVQPSQRRQRGHQPLRREQRRHRDPQMHPQLRLADPFDRARHRIDVRRDLFEEARAGGINLKPIMLPVEQRRPDELLERLDSPRQRRRRQRQAFGGRLERAQPDNGHESLDRSNGRKPAHPPLIRHPMVRRNKKRGRTRGARPFERFQERMPRKARSF